MNRTFRVVVVTALVLAISLGFGTAFAKKNGKPNQSQNTPAVASIAISLIDWQGKTLAPDATGSAYVAVTGHKYSTKVVVTPETARASFRWRSSRPRVASVSNRGVIFCNRPGTAEITVATKSGAKLTFTIEVKANMTAFDTTADKTVKTIYLRGNNLYIDVVVVNSTTEPMDKAENLAFSLQLFGEEGYPDLGVKSGYLRKVIPAGESGTATYWIKKVDFRKIWLLDAKAECRMP